MGWRGNRFGGDEDRPEFNQAALFIARLDNMSGLINECLRANDLNGASLLVTQMFVMIEYRIKKKDEVELFGKTYKDCREDIEKKLNTINNLLAGQESTIRLNHKKIVTDLKEICRLLYSLQWDLGFIFPEKTVKYWQDEVRNDFS